MPGRLHEHALFHDHCGCTAQTQLHAGTAVSRASCSYHKIDCPSRQLAEMKAVPTNTLPAYGDIGDGILRAGSVPVEQSHCSGAIL